MQTAGHKKNGGQYATLLFNIMLRNRVITDPTGKELAGLEAAHWQAVRLGYQVRFHLPDDDEPWIIQIEDETRRTRELFVPSFAPALPRPLNTALTARAHR
jgi:hypothetical protein